MTVHDTGTKMQRRGILAAAGVVVAGMLAKQAAQPVAAATTMMIADSSTAVTNAVLGQTNITGPIPTGLAILVADARSSNSNANGLSGLGSHAGAGVVGQGGAANGLGVFGKGGTGNGGGGPGVVGLTSELTAPLSIGPIGVYGYTTQDNAIGVFGSASTYVGVYGTAAGPNGYGVNGDAHHIGVYGRGIADTTGVLGESVAADGVETGNGNGVVGKTLAGKGVYGLATTGNAIYGESSSGNGVYGTTNGTGTVAGVYGISTSAYGVIGSTTAAGYSGLTAITGTAGVAALAATSTSPSAYAAYFQGDTAVQGNFVAFGGIKSAAVKDARGQHRLVYCVESPESWFEDFGEGKLVNGKAEVALDTTFAEIVHTDSYHVFLTEHSDHHLHVSSRTPSGFTVDADTELAAVKGEKIADLVGTFSWRVVAKRKDIAGERLAKFAVPKINHPDPDKLPKLEPPKR